MDSSIWTGILALSALIVSSFLIITNVNWAFKVNEINKEMEKHVSEYREQAIRLNNAYYDTKTGQFTWKDNTQCFSQTMK